MTIRIIVADDHPIFRDGLVRSLEESGIFEVAATCASAEEAIRLSEAERPDVALLDLSMPGGGIAAARGIAALDPAPRIAMLTVSEESSDVVAALEAGAIGYVLKGVSAGELCGILEGIAKGYSHISPSLAAQVLRIMQDPRARQRRRPIDDLTKREEDILRRVARGMSNREVAEELGLQEKTVKHYMTGILGKLQARNRVEAANIANEAWGNR